MTKILVKLLALSLFTAAQTAMAANYYVRAGATGANNGADWTNAYTTLPGTLIRGATYYIADGSYSGYTFDDNASGTTPITIKKCTANDHGTGAGYNSSYCDGKATFTGQFAFTRPYYIIDGAKRNEGNWKDHASYGFSIRSFRTSRSDGGHSPSTECSGDNITVKYTHVGSTGTTWATTSGNEGFYIAGFGNSGPITCDNWIIQRSLVQNTTLGIMNAGGKGHLIEYNYFYIGWGKESIRGQHDSRNIIIRHNIFEDSCMTKPGTGDVCTAEIAMWGWAPVGNYDNIEIYGNVFFKTATFGGSTQQNTNGIITLGGDGVVMSGANAPARNSRVYNNTSAGHTGTAIIKFPGGTGNICQNNVWFNDQSPSTAGCTASNNAVLTGTPFVNYAAGDFRLSGP